MTKRLKIISLNVWGLPWPFSHYLKKRLSKTISFLKDQNADIVSLQEIWSHKDVARLKKEFPDYFFVTSGIGEATNQSGLLIMTKFKPLEKFFYMFKRPLSKRIDETFAGKGILVCLIKLDNKDCFILNTHAFARSKKKHIMFLSKQLKFLKKIVKRFHSLILTGDLNINTNEFLEWNDNHLKVSLTKNPEFDKKNPYRKFAPMHYLDDGDTASYIAVKTNPQKIKIKTKILDNIYLSDHQPLVSEIEFI